MSMSNEGKRRKYQETHPWIKFCFDASHLNYRIWMLLGEAKSKCEHIMGAPLLPKTIQDMHRVYLAKGALATTAIEGNTLTESEVEKRIQGDLILPPSKEYLGKEIDNIVEAYNLIGDRLLRKRDPDQLSVDLVKEFNKLVLKSLPLEERIVPGAIRTYSFGVANYRAVPPEDCEYLLERYTTWLNNEFVFPEEDKVIYGILKAIIAHLFFVWIHPFGDGNGRTARLIEFQILLSAGIPSVAAHLLSNHYNQTRSEYYRNLDRSSKVDCDISDFIQYALQGFVDGLKSEIESIQIEQVDVHWINHIHNSFKGKNSPADERKKELMLEISKNNPKASSLNDLRYSSPRVAEMYVNLSERTLYRDVSDLIEMGLLVQKEDRSYICNLQVLKLFLVPVRKG